VDGKQTAVTDVKDFELPFGASLRIFEGYIYKMLWKTFQYRKMVTNKALL
jgi:hypothetical protein